MNSKTISIFSESEKYIARTHSMDTDMIEYQDGKQVLKGNKKKI